MKHSQKPTKVILHNSTSWAWVDKIQTTKAKILLTGLVIENNTFQIYMFMVHTSLAENDDSVVGINKGPKVTTE